MTRPPVPCSSVLNSDADGELHKQRKTEVCAAELSDLKVDLTQVQRVLIIKMSAMGDVIHALPVSAALKEAYPHLEISWAVEDAFAPLVANNPYLHKVFTLPKMRGRQLRSAKALRDCGRRLNLVRQERFDVTLDLQGLTKSATVALWSGAKIRLGYHWLRELAPLVEQAVPQCPESVHIVEQYLDVARFLGADPKTVQFPLPVPEADDATVVQMLADAGVDASLPFVAINPASAQQIKMWGAEKYGALIDVIADEMGLPSVLVTADTEVAAAVAACAHRPFTNLARRTTLLQLAAVLKRCVAHVCSDTGSGHIAAAFARPVISIVGPTDPDRACPYGQRATTLCRRECCGSACNHHHCEFARPRCLQAVQVEDVVQTLRRVVPISQPAPCR